MASITAIGPRIVALALVACVPACTLFAPTARESGFVSTLPTPTVAWMCAAACRDEMPAGDSLPMHGNPAIVRHGTHGFVVRYVDAGDGFRAYRNGRISPPDRHAAALGGCRFRAEPLSGNAAFGLRREVRIEIRGNGPDTGGCRVTVTLRGRVEDDLALRLATVHDVLLNIARLQRSDDPAAIVRGATTELARLDQRHALERSLAARLHFLAARAELAEDQLAAARTGLRRALKAAPDLAVARRLLARTCRRLADAGGVLTHGRADVALPRLGDTDALLRGAEELLTQGDLLGATHWTQRAVTRAPGSRAATLLLARIYIARGMTREALAAHLLVLERFGFDADLALVTAREHAKLGNDVAGVRLLQRYRHQLELAAPRRLANLTRRLCRELPGGLAFRILRRSGAALAQDFRSGIGPSCTELFSRFEELRRTHDADPTGATAVASLPGRDYAMAPGVMPAK